MVVKMLFFVYLWVDGSGAPSLNRGAYAPSLHRMDNHGFTKQTCIDHAKEMNAELDIKEGRYVCLPRLVDNSKPEL